ncbi:hypothetical protein SAMN04488511_101154 [Pedobacter suwonensis]|uniref:Uncharacterized protein n=1 Tax=Pedobacter suwonensis TaxID=332999 RepID=A0A1I0SFF8_9SPHI|nr:hypothetical protein SAMN04488511_101154 [Pedobacter suwonensis]
MKSIPKIQNTRLFESLEPKFYLSYNQLSQPMEQGSNDSFNIWVIYYKFPDDTSIPDLVYS